MRGQDLKERGAQKSETGLRLYLSLETDADFKWQLREWKTEVNFQ